MVGFSRASHLLMIPIQGTMNAIVDGVSRQHGPQFITKVGTFFMTTHISVLEEDISALQYMYVLQNYSRDNK